MQMLTKLMKGASIAALLFTALFWRVAVHYQLLVEFVVCLGALIVVMQAFRAKQYEWAVGFMAIAVLFNPIVPVFRLGLSHELWILIVLACVAAFALSVNATAVKPRVLLSIPSITDRNPGSVSL